MTRAKAKATDTESQQEQKATDTESQQASNYPTEYYKAAGIAYCQTCGEKLRTKSDGAPLCPIAQPDCDRNV
jgi:hypothetical protein